MAATDSVLIPEKVRAGVSAPVYAPLLIVLLLALFSTLPFLLGTNFPLNDGGMFAQIMDDLRVNHFRLLHETRYNFEHIPMAYPPLAFYVGDVAAEITGQSSTAILRWMPLAFTVGCVLIFYFLAMEFLEEPYLAFCAAIIYAVLPRSSEWLMMGGGLTRSLGEFFVLLAVCFFLQAGRRDSKVRSALAGLFTGRRHFDAPRSRLTCSYIFDGAPALPSAGPAEAFIRAHCGCSERRRGVALGFVVLDQLWHGAFRCSLPQSNRHTGSVAGCSSVGDCGAMLPVTYFLCLQTAAFAALGSGHAACYPKKRADAPQHHRSAACSLRL